MVVNMVAEHGLPQPQEQIPERTCEQVVDVRMPQVVGQVFEVLKISSQDRDLRGTVEQIPDILVPEMVDTVGGSAGDRFPMTESSSGLWSRSLTLQFRRLWRNWWRSLRVFSQDRIQQRFLEQINETPAVSLAEKIVERPVRRKKRRNSVNTHAQHVVNTVEVERPKIIKQTVQKTIIQEKINQVTKHVVVPHSQFNDKVVDIPVVRQISTVHVEMKTAETPQLQIPGKMIDVHCCVGRASSTRVCHEEDS